MGEAGTGKPKVSPEHLPHGARKEGHVPNEETQEAHLMEDAHWPKLEQLVQ